MKLTVLFPCLNEEETIGACIDEAKQALDGKDIDYEMIVADNGSTDGTARIAESAGARVVPVSDKGYGHALRAGIEAAAGEYVIFADADGSYRLGDIPALYEKAVSENADMVIASRRKGEIEDGAMPFLHRFLGTPVLTFLINVLFGGRISDCNSGFRCIRRAALQDWNVHAGGMEFASETVIGALKHGARISEIPSGLRKDKRSRAPYLSTWRDGMRHLLFILSEKPQLMERTGLIMVVLTSLLQVVAYLLGPTSISRFNVFDYHTHALLLLGGCLGVQLYLLGCYVYIMGEERPLKLTRHILNMDEASVFFVLTATLIAGAGLTFLVFLIWMGERFGDIDIINPFLVILHLLFIAGFMSIGLLGVHILKRARC